MLVEAKRAQIRGSEYSVLAKSGFHERSYFHRAGFHVRAGGGAEGWDNSNARTNQLQYITMNQCK